MKIRISHPYIIRMIGGAYMKCEICNKEIKGFTNNAYPLKDGVCCDECNEKLVVPTRLFLAGCLSNNILILKSDDSVELRWVEGELSLKEVQEIVEGYIELVPIKNDKFFFIVNEEGLLKGLEVNELARQMFGLDVVGNLIVCPKHLCE